MKTKIQTHLRNSALVCSALAAAIPATASTDYAPAIWRPICEANYYTSGYGHKFHVIHDIEGYYASTMAWFDDCGMTNASIHYITNGKKDATSDAPAGEITQLGVRESQYGWHARCWNQHSTGTEHEGFASNPAWFTDEQYQTSADCTRHLADKFGYAKDRNHVIAHGQKSVSGWPAYASANLGIDPYCNTHTDPGPYWDWTKYMNMVNASGVTHDLHVVGDWDGNGTVTPGAVRKENGNLTWYLRNSNSSGSADITFVYGVDTDQPVAGDWDGNGTWTPGVFRGNSWLLRNSNSSGSANLNFAFGQAGDKPVVGDWDGNLTVTIGVVRGTTWYVRNSNSGGTHDVTFAYGQSGDKFVTGDWDGNGTYTPGVVRSTTWYLRNALSGGTHDVTFAYGQSGDEFIPGNWDGSASNKTWTPGVIRETLWYLKNSNVGGSADIQFGYGQ